MSFYGKSVETGALFYELLLLGGGQGASQTKDGKLAAVADLGGNLHRWKCSRPARRSSSGRRAC